MPPFIPNYGYKPSIIDPNVHHVLGKGQFQGAILMPNGHGWGAYLPVDEIQSKNGLETENCTNYGTNHIIATLGKRLFDSSFQTNFSERYTGIMTGTGVGGNDPHRVAEIIRLRCGLVPEIFLPYDQSIDTWQKYYSPNPMKYPLYAVGAHWLRKYKLSHDWVFLPGVPLAQKQSKMKYALQFSPLGASVYAWSLHDDGMYYSDQPYQNHWIEVYDYLDGQYWMVFDSYDQTHKKLDWNFDFGQCKRYGLSYNTGGQLIGDQPESVLLPYSLYFAQWYLGEILK